MMWGAKSEKFSQEKKQQTFNTFSEYLRYQFQLSKNASHVDILSDLRKTRKNDTPPVSPSPTSFQWKGGKSVKSVVPEQVYLTSADGSSGQKEVKLRPFSATGRKKPSPYAETQTPGPGQYHNTATLVKPSFNTTFNSPPELNGSRKHVRDAPVPQMTNNRNGAFLNASKYRSLSAPACGRREGEAVHSFSIQGSPTGYDSSKVSKQNPALMNARYPPASDQVIKRYSTVAAVSYTHPVPVPKKVCHETVLVPSPGKHKSQIFE